MKFQSLRNISVVFAAALILLSPRVRADADVSGGGALFEKLPIYRSPKDRPLTGKVDLKSVDGFKLVEISGMQNSDSSLLPKIHLNDFEWRIYHRSFILIHPMAGLAADKD
jgi:hypothetical protein